jgi:hypothetical protein
MPIKMMQKTATAAMTQILRSFFPDIGFLLFCAGY